MRCRTCTCKQPWLLGHTFGVSEQFFTHLLPPSLKDSPFHFSATPTWRCRAAACEYAYAASSEVTHLPLQLSSTDVACLLADGVAPEVGELCAAHLLLSRCPLRRAKRRERHAARRRHADRRGGRGRPSGPALRRRTREACELG